MEEGVAHRGEAHRRGRFSWSVHVQGATAATEGTEAEAQRERLTAQLEEARTRLAQVEKEFAQWRDRRQALLAARRKVARCAAEATAHTPSPTA